MACLPLFPAILRDLDAPFCDISMGAYAMLAMAFAGLAVEAQRTETKRQWYWIAASGLACLLAAKSKETGLAVTPAVLWMLLAHEDVSTEGSNLQGDATQSQAATAQRRLKAAGKIGLIWIAGALFAWALLACADAAFLGDFGHSFNPRAYLHRFPNIAASAASHQIVRAPKHGTDFLNLLTTKAFWGWLVLATAGGLHGFKRNAIVRGVVLWGFSSIVLSSLVASVYSGIYAVPRYLVVPGMPFVVLAAYYAVAVWRVPIARPAASWWLRALLIGTTCLLVQGVRSNGLLATRSAEFVLPWLLVFLAFVPMRTDDKWAGRVAIVLLAIVVAYGSLVEGMGEHLARRQRMAPWDKLAHHLEALRERTNSRPRVALCQLGKPFGEVRVRRRLEARVPALSDGVTVRVVRSPGGVNAFDDVVITRPKRLAGFIRNGWKLFVAARVPADPESGHIDFVVLVRA
jgi:hypothetical protein